MVVQVQFEDCPCHFSAVNYTTASHILSVHFFFLSGNPHAKWLGHATDPSPPSSSKVNNAWSCTCIPFYLCALPFVVNIKTKCLNYCIYPSSLIKSVKIFLFLEG